jgi:hypothetical protein
MRKLLWIMVSILAAWFAPGANAQTMDEKDLMDDAVKVKCSRCTMSFRDRAGRLRDGYSRECPNCNVLIFFESESPDVNVRRASRNFPTIFRDRETDFLPLPQDLAAHMLGPHSPQSRPDSQGLSSLSFTTISHSTMR